MSDRYFLNVGTDFNTTANWSTTSGGGAGASVPTSADRIILDANSGNLILEININVKGILMDTGYAGTFTQGAFTIDYGSSYFTVIAGTFVGSNGGHAITGATNSRFIQSGGTFTSTSGTHQVGVGGIGVYTMDITGGIFNHNNGKILVFGSNHTHQRNLSGYPFFDYEINTCISCTHGGEIYVDNLLTSTICNNSGLIVNLKGDYVQNSGGLSVVFEGTGDQDFTVASTSLLVGSVTINKPSGTLNIINDIKFNVNWTHTQGTINWNGKKAFAFIIANGRVITNGQFYDLETQMTSGVSVGTAGSTIQVENDLTFNNSTGSNNFPSVKVGGNFYILTSFGTCTGGVEFNGTGTQNFTSSVSSFNIPITINKASGTVELLSNFAQTGTTSDLNLIAGTFNQNGFDLTIADTFNQTGGIYNQGAGTLDLFRFFLTLGTFNEGSQGIICRGTDFSVSASAIFNRSLIGGGLFADTAVSTALLLNMNGYILSNFSFARLTQNLTLGSSLNINGYYKKSSTATTANVIGAGFVVSIGGNVEQNNLYSSRTLSTSPTFVFNGVSDQTVIASDGKLDSGIWQVNKPSGKVTQLSDITIDNGQAGDNGLNNLVILAGVWCTNQFNLTVDGTIIILSSAELRKTPTSVITGIIAGVVTNVSSCDEKKTAFFLVE